MKTIIVGLNWLGDIIMSLPAIIAATENSEVHILTRPHLAEVYGLAGIPLQLHPVATDAGILQVLKELQPLRRLKADSMIVLPDSLRAAILARICNSRRSTGFATQWRSLLLDQPVAKPADFKRRHESELHFMLVKEAGVALNRPELVKGSFSDQLFKSVADKIGLKNGSSFMTLAPGAAFGAAKRWPPQKFAEVADLLYSRFHLPLVITAGAGERDLAAEICSRSQAALINAAGSTSLTELACLLSRSRLLIANDSGTMHLAALYGTPTVVPVGPTDMARTAPLNANFRAVHTEVCPQAPCRQRTCPRADHICMEAIKADMVFAAAEALLENYHG